MWAPVTNWKVCPDCHSCSLNTHNVFLSLVTSNSLPQRKQFLAGCYGDSLTQLPFYSGPEVNLRGSQSEANRNYVQFAEGEAVVMFALLVAQCMWNSRNGDGGFVLLMISPAWSCFEMIILTIKGIWLQIFTYMLPAGVVRRKKIFRRMLAKQSAGSRNHVRPQLNQRWYRWGCSMHRNSGKGKQSVSLETFYYQLMHIMLKNTELLKHSKITLQHVSVYIETIFRELQSVLG